MNVCLELPSWQTRIIFFVDETEESLKKTLQLNKKNVTLAEVEELRDALKDDTIDGQVNSFVKGGYYCMIKSPFEELCYSHEIFHVANRILVDRGVTHDGSAEPWAYLIGQITKVYMREILPEVKKDRKKRKTKTD